MVLEYQDTAERLFMVWMPPKKVYFNVDDNCETDWCSSLWITYGNAYINCAPTLFGTRVILILDISISSYSINHFSILFIYFILPMKP